MTTARRARRESGRRTTRKTLTAACGQFFVGPDLSRNLRLVSEQMAEAKERFGAQLLVFPETALSGYAPVHWGCRPERLDFAFLAAALREVQAWARRRRLAVAVGSTVRRRGKYYNRAYLISAAGEIVGRYDKMHLMGAADGTRDAACYEAGRRLLLCNWAGVPTTPLICADVRFPEPWRLAASAGARLFVHLSAAFGREGLYKKEAMRAHLISRAAENGCWAASANAAGPFQFAETMIVDPDGRVAARAEANVEQVIAARIEPARPGGEPFLKMRRPRYRSPELPGKIRKPGKPGKPGAAGTAGEAVESSPGADETTVTGPDKKSRERRRGARGKGKR